METVELLGRLAVLVALPCLIAWGAVGFLGVLVAAVAISTAVVTVNALLNRRG